MCLAKIKVDSFIAMYCNYGQNALFCNKLYQMNKPKFYSYSVRTKDEKLNDWLQSKIRELDCSICDFIKQLLIKEYKKENDGKGL